MSSTAVFREVTRDGRICCSGKYFCPACKETIRQQEAAKVATRAAATSLRRADDVAPSPTIGVVERIRAARGVQPPSATNALHAAAAKDCAPSPTHGLIERIRANTGRTK